jgi:hypothetical protein
MCTLGRVTWSFTAVVEPARVSKLEHWRSFDDIAAAVVAASVAPLHWEPANATELAGCHRASYDLTVDPDIYDAFFNAHAGYRAQYALNEATGTAANRLLLDLLYQVSFRMGPKHESASADLIEMSLRGAQAKVWIVESEVESQLGDPHRSINWATWEFNEPDGQGLRAPRGTRLEVKGGWVDHQGREVIYRPKLRRANNIYRTGDSK